VTIYNHRITWASTPLGVVTVTGWHQGDLTAGVAAAVAAASTATPTLWRATALATTPNPSGLAAPYDLDTIAALQFKVGASSNVVQVSIPAPSAGIFKADTFTVDPSNALAAAVIAAVQSLGTSRAGATGLVYVSGRRQGIALPPLARQ